MDRRVKPGDDDGEMEEATGLLRLEALQRRGRLREAHEVHELAPVTERIRALAGVRERDHVVVAERAGVAATAEDLAERRHRRSEAGLARRVAAARRTDFVRGRDRRLDELTR